MIIRLLPILYDICPGNWSCECKKARRKRFAARFYIGKLVAE